MRDVNPHIRSEMGDWLGGVRAGDREEFRQAVEFLFTVRCFLHYRHERDDNTLDWHAQDAAAAMGIGMGRIAYSSWRTRLRRGCRPPTGCGSTSVTRAAWNAV